VFGKNLSKLDSPLIETIASENESFNCNSVFINGEKLTAVISSERSLEKKTH